MKIKSEKNFYKYLWLYKSLFFRFTNFELNSKNEEVNNIVTALNIKNRKDRITFIYDYSCDLIDNKFKGENICGFNNKKCYSNICNKKGMYGCCHKCLYKSDTGCISRNISCKLFNCIEVRKRYDVLTYNNIKIFKLLSFKNKVIIKHDYFSLREDVLKDMYSYSFVYSFFRIIYRNIRNLIKVKNEENKL